MLEPLLAAVARARTKLKKESEEIADDFVGGYRDAPKKVKKATDEIAKETEKAAKKRAKDADKAARDEARAYEYVYRIKQRYLEQEEKAAEKALKKRQELVKTMTAGAGRTFMGIAGKAVGVAGSIARGAGVQLDIGGSVGRAVNAQAAATTLSNNAYQPGGAGAAGVRQDPKAILAEVRDAADATATSVDSAMAGLQGFVGKTGDLDTGRKVLTDLAKLSKATGSNLDDMENAAGDAYQALQQMGETPAPEKILSVMRSMAGQGKLGAIEIADLAKKMAKLSAAASSFEGDPGKTMTVLGAIAQEARQRGGASSAAEAATSVSGFVNILKTPARLKQFTAAGFKHEDLYNEKGQLRDPEKIIKKSLDLKGTDPIGFKKIWANVAGGRAVEGFANIYRANGGGAKGMAAVEAEFARLKNAAMGEGEIAESFKARMGDADSKVQLFNNSIDRIAADNLPKLAASMEQLAPLVTQAASSFATLVGWAAENPMTAVVAALVASVAKAGIGAALEAAVAKNLATAAAGQGISIGGTATIGIATAVLTVAAVSAEKGIGVSAAKQEVGETSDVISTAIAERKKNGSVSAETLRRLRQRRDVVAGELNATKMGVGTELNAFNPFSDTSIQDVGRAQQLRASNTGGVISNQATMIDAILADAAAPHKQAAAAHEKAAAAVERAANRLGNTSPGHAPGATTGPAPVR